MKSGKTFVTAVPTATETQLHTLASLEFSKFSHTVSLAFIREHLLDLAFNGQG